MGQTEEPEVKRRAMKLLREYKHLPYAERVKYLDLPTLRFRNGLPSLQFSYNGNDIKLAKSHVRYDIRSTSDS